MSRIGNQIIDVPASVKVNIAGQTISAKGPHGELSFTVPEPISFELEGGKLRFKRPDDVSHNRALHGMSRAMTANMINGCAAGYKRELEIVGVGYRAAVKGNTVDLTLGFSHPVRYELPDGVKAEVTKEGILVLFSADKAKVGQVAADIRRYRPPEPYKGKGVRFVGERILRKEGKRGKK